MESKYKFNNTNTNTNNNKNINKQNILSKQDSIDLFNNIHNNGKT